MKNNLINIALLSLLGLVYSTSTMASLKPFYKEVSDEWHCGYRDEAGKIVIPINKKYEECGEFSDGLAYVGMMPKPFVEDQNGNHMYLQGFIDQTGKLVIPIELEVVSDDLMGAEYKSFSEGLVAVYKNGKYGYMNKKRELVIPYRYKDADEFKDGLAIVVNQNDRYGAIDQSGKTVVPIKFGYLGGYSDGLSLYTENNRWDENEKYGFVDKKGNVSIKASWDRAYSFSEGLAAVRVGNETSGKWGIIDTSGNFVVKPKYDNSAIQLYTDAYFFEDGYYKEGNMYMYNYTDANQPDKSSIMRYTLNRQGKVISQKLYANWDALSEEYERLNP